MSAEPAVDRPGVAEETIHFGYLLMTLLVTLCYDWRRRCGWLEDCLPCGVFEIRVKERCNAQISRSSRVVLEAASG